MRDRLHSILSPRRADAWLAIVLFVLAATTGMIYVSTWGGTPSFQQEMYGPAVMWACGRGFENPMLSKAPALEDFLFLRSDHFSAEDLPADLPVVPADTSGWNAEDWRQYHPHPDFGGWLNFQRFHFYLFMTVAILWRILGVSWEALTPLYGLLYGITAVAAFGLFRLAARRPLAAVMTVLFILAPLHLQMLPHLRDYAKAPFFLSAIFLISLIVKNTMTPRRQAAYSATCGLLVGTGIGFRQDVLLCVPVFLAVVAVFASGRIRETWKGRLVSATVFLACFLAAGGPILYVLFAKGNNSSHDTLIGTLQYCDQRLGVGSPVYDLGAPFLDEYTRAVVESYDYRVNGNAEPLRHYTAAYDRAASAYFLDLVKTFPADFLIRAYASTLRILDEVRPDPAAPWPLGIAHPVVKQAYRVYERVVHVVLSHGRYCALLALLLLSARSPRMGFYALFLLGWLAGYPALRFSIRHCFHLQLVSFWMAGFLIQRGLDTVSAVRAGKYKQEGFARECAAGAGKAGLFLVLSAMLIMVPLWGLRTYQQWTVTALFRAYENAPTESLALCVTPQQNGNLLETPHLALVPSTGRTHPVDTECLVLELDAAPGQRIPITLLYKAGNPLWDFTRVFEVCAPAHGPTGVSHVYVPVYFGAGFDFRGFLVPTENTATVKGIRRITDLHSPAVLIPTALYPGWPDMPLYYALTR